MTDALFLACMAFLAGQVDSVVGGGGLIQIRALSTVLPEALPASIFGTHLALRHGNVFIRRIFLALATALIAKFGYDTLR